MANSGFSFFPVRHLRCRQEGSLVLPTPAIITEETLGKDMLCLAVFK